ncbi:thiazolylpeptide-type bacteriocin [Staphylospora marina]|uniref:thiazolylpeptide-type bacteriocin n=1 Tax=Staphylospora marina TaxID=2490858 RepID=UPI001F150650|nr:thiazolylpeptide-type bacteriocin [Staphylospora marina]
MVEVKDLEITGLDIMDLSDAAALPETGASSGESSCSVASSTCGSSSCCSSCW